MNEGVQEPEQQLSELSSLLGDNKTARWVLVGIFLVIALVSAIPAGNHFSSPDAYQRTIASLDEKRNVVTGLTALSAASSAAVSALPGDAGTPIAERLIGLSEDFLIILTALYLEKFLLTTFGFAAFRILIPLGCLFAIAAVLMASRGTSRGFAGRAAAKLFLLGIMIAAVVPASIFISDKMEETHNASLATTLESISGEAASLENAEEAATPESDNAASEEGFFQKLQQLFSGAGDVVGNVADTLASSLNETKEKALNLLSTLTDSLALLIVTSCIIPILVLLLFLWLMKMVLGIDATRAVGFLRPRVMSGASRFKG